MLLMFALVAVPVAACAEKAGDGHVDYLGPTALVVSADGRTLFVACYDAHRVLWISLPSGKVIRQVPVPGPPTGVALTVDQQRLIVTCAGPRSTITILNTQSGKSIATIQSGHTSVSPVVDTAGQRLYVCDRFDNRVSVFDLQTGGCERSVAMIREPIAAALTPDGNELVVANHLPNMRTDVSVLGEVRPVVSILDTRNWQVESVYLPNGSNGLRGVYVTPDGHFAFVTHLLSNFQEVPFRIDTGWINTNVVSMIDLRTRRVISTIGLDEMDVGAANPWGVAGTADGRYLAVAASGTHEVCVIEQSILMDAELRRTMCPMMGVWPIYVSLGRSQWQRIALSGRGPRAVATHGDTLYVAQYFSDTIDVVDCVTPATWRWTIQLGPPPTETATRRGEQLFHDGTICYQHWQSCASCHPDGRTDGLNWDLTNDGQGNAKNTKSLLYAHRTPPAMAVGVRETAQEAVRSGLTHILFQQRPETEANAIDQYLRSLAPVASSVLVGGKLSPAADRGKALFMSKRVGCARCHPPPLYTDKRLHDVGTRGTKDRVDRFDTPTLVEVWRTAPYLHDGRYLTVRELLQVGHHGLRKKIRQELTQTETDELIEFVLSLGNEEGDPRALADQFKKSATAGVRQ